MNVIQGDMWSELGQADLLLVTTNAAVNIRTAFHSSGDLVMGRGAALEAKTRFPQLPRDLGAKLKQRNQIGKAYGVLLSDIKFQGTRLGAFQVKYHWRDQADIELISQSAIMLRDVIALSDYQRVALNFPGIGNGRLEREGVEHLLEKYWGELDNIHVYWK